MLEAFAISLTHEFVEWFDSQGLTTQELVRVRMARIQIMGHFGESRHVGDRVLELKWKSGLRVYFAYSGRLRIVVLLGGTKHGQKKDIRKAKQIARREDV